MRRSDLGWILLLAAAVRALLYLLWSPDLTGDSVAYHDLAVRLAGGEGFVSASGAPTSWRPPLYPLFVGGVYLVTGAASRAVRWFQLPVDLASVALTWWLAGRLFGRRAAAVAGVLAAVNLAAVAASGRVLSETLFTFLILAATAALVKALEPEERALPWAAGAGALLGAAALTRGVALLYPLPAAALLAWSLRRRGAARSRITAPPAVLLASFVLVLAPWTIRNWKVQGAFVPVASQGGYTLYSSYHPPDGWRFGMRARDEVSERASGMPEPAADRYLTRETLRSVVERPGRLPRLELLKVLFHWVPLDWEVLPREGTFNPTYALIAILAALYGVRRLRGGDPPGRPSWPVWLPVAYLFAMALVFYGSPRFRLPSEPFLAVFAGAGLAGRMERRGPRRALAETGALLAALVALVFVVEPLKALARRWVAGGPG